MADNNSTMNSNDLNQTMKAEQAKAEVSRHRQHNSQTDDQRQERGAIGGGRGSSQSKTAEQGRARDEIGSDQGSVTPR